MVLFIQSLLNTHGSKTNCPYRHFARRPRFCSRLAHIFLSILLTIFPKIVWEGPHFGNSVALTFDDGPDPTFTPLVLRILETDNIKATFFLVGERARRYPDLVNSIRTSGHEIGNHSNSWRKTILLTLGTFEEDLVEAERALGLDRQPRFFRPAGVLISPKQLQIVRKHNYYCVLGSAYAFDPHHPPAAYIKWAIRRSLRPGAIIVLHDSGGDRSNTIRALPTIIADAQKRGLRFRTLSELLPQNLSTHQNS